MSLIEVVVVVVGATRSPDRAVSLALISSKIACRLDRTGKAWTGGAICSGAAWSLPLLEVPSSEIENGRTSLKGEYLLFTSAVPSRYPLMSLVHNLYHV